jgi:hypothetical protein
MAWNEARVGIAAAPAVAIDWSVTAMTETTTRFEWAGSWTLSRAASAINETVWWVTLLDATLVRYHAHDYENTLAALGPAKRRQIEETLTGLRYVRNLLGRSVDAATLISPAGSGAPSWTWTPLAEPAAAAGQSERNRDWEMSRYRAYQARLAGHDVSRSFTRCAAFLEQAAIPAPEHQITPASADATR